MAQKKKECPKNTPCSFHFQDLGWFRVKSVSYYSQTTLEPCQKHTGVLVKPLEACTYAEFSLFE